MSKKKDPEARPLLNRIAELEEELAKKTQEASRMERDLEIENALERVRTRAMAMQHSDELSNTISVLFEQLAALGVNPINTYLVLYDLESNRFNFRMTGKGGSSVPYEMILSFDDLPQFHSARRSWESGQPVIEIEYPPENRQDGLNLFTPINQRLPREAQLCAGDFPDGIFNCSGRHAFGSLGITHYRPANEQEKNLLIRFARQFELVYKRFLDLQKAEAQAREAQIEAALERVRSTSLAIHKSEELHKVVLTVSQEINSLGLNISAAHIYRFEEGNDKGVHMWIAGDGGIYPYEIYLPYIKHEFFDGVYDARTTNKNFFKLSGTSKKEKNRLYRHLINSTKIKVSEDRKKFALDSKSWTYSVALGKHSGIALLRFTEDEEEKFCLEDNEILKRFSKAFEQAYIRFMDLQKAETQAREAQIEAALERVRTQTMAMHNSQDVGISVTTFFDELVGLGIAKSIRCGIGILGETNIMELWTASSNSNVAVDLKIGHLDMSLHPLLRNARNAWKNKLSSFTYELVGEDMLQYYTVINNAPDYPVQIDLETLPEKIIHYDFVFPDGILFAFTEHPIPDDVKAIFKRFAIVFGHTYTRFQDLKRAEERARESEIEASLERVRAKAMAMHSSTDLLDTTSVLIHELNSLNVHPARLGIAEIMPENKIGRIFTTQVEGQKQDLRLMADVTLEGHPVFEMILSHWEQEKEYFPVLKGKLMASYYKALHKQNIKVNPPAKGSVQYGLFMFYEKVGIYAWSEEPYTEDVLDVFRKYTTVLGLTYQRYKDLKEAESRALESKRDASLDRVRAVIASMRTAEDLKRITPLIWQELTILEVPFFRCGVFIVDESTEHIQLFLTTPTGESLAALNLPYGTSDLLDRTLSHWKAQKILKQEWTREEFVEWAQSIVNQGYLEDTKSYQGGDAPPEHLALHFVPFSQGMLYVGSAGPLEQSQLELVQSLAEAFSVAYARYEDFIKLESAHAELGKTLEHLKSTQAQLIQSEKMASLGELTAGIAHEIQNPLNFVNNFSEINMELIDELKAERSKMKGERDEALEEEILKILKENEQKIQHHGKRADGIVKGMLQHSRVNQGEEELTDINALCDEYLRLAYHGFRAKDKSFNTTLETDYDDTIGMIDVIPQDIGRVVLNLINNAFYVVAEKSAYAKASADKNYEPTVTVSTKKMGDNILISVKDNGNGIPPKVLDKIFQPFFTTKPTGQGTGLGLSLSYDVVKAHGGEIRLKVGKEKERCLLFNCRSESLIYGIKGLN